MNDLIKKATDKSRLYPELEIPFNTHPNKLYAIPFLGLLIKFIILIPVFIVGMGLGIATFILMLINPFYVLANGVYWKTAYEVLSLEICYTVKIMTFLYGLTDKYPGFNFNIEGFTLKVPINKDPNKLYAIPLIGLVIRVILLIPFSIFSSIISNGASIGIFLAGWIPVLFNGRYAQSLHEIAQDSIRIQLTSLMYFTGLEDRYPSFWISMKHKNIKIVLIVIGILITLNSYMNHPNDKNGARNYHQSPNMLQNQNYNSTPNTYNQ